MERKAAQTSGGDWVRGLSRCLKWGPWISLYRSQSSHCGNCNFPVFPPRCEPSCYRRSRIDRLRFLLQRPRLYNARKVSGAALPNSQNQIDGPPDGC